MFTRCGSRIASRVWGDDRRRMIPMVLLRPSISNWVPFVAVRYDFMAKIAPRLISGLHVLGRGRLIQEQRRRAGQRQKADGNGCRCARGHHRAQAIDSHDTTDMHGKLTIRRRLRKEGKAWDLFLSYSQDFFLFWCFFFLPSPCCCDYMQETHDLAVRDIKIAAIKDSGSDPSPKFSRKRVSWPHCWIRGPAGVGMSKSCTVLTLTK